MKIALCIANLITKGRQGPKAFVDGYIHLKEQILDKYKNVDVFLHSYESEVSHILIDMYKPKKSLFEPSTDFQNFYKNLSKNFCNYGNKETFTYKNLFSMTSSRYKVGLLKSEYEIENNFKYDWVIFCRFDINSANHIEGIEFDSNLDNSFLYMPMFSQLNAGPQDQWFFSNSCVMDIIFDLHNNINRFFQDDSPFVKSATQNWIDSNKTDRFSCELLLELEKKCITGEKIPTGAISNGHLLYKWHLYENKMWSLDCLRFIIPKKNLVKYTIEHHTNIINYR